MSLKALFTLIGFFVLGHEFSWALRINCPDARLGPPPRYFAGTNCLASGEAFEFPANTQVMAQRLYIRGVCVKEMGPSDPNSETHVGLAVRFDSSWFQEGWLDGYDQSLVVRYEVDLKDIETGTVTTHSGSMNAPLKNRLVKGCHSQYDPWVGMNVNHYLNNLPGYQIVEPVNASSFDAKDWLDSLDGANALFIATHSNEFWHESRTIGSHVHTGGPIPPQAPPTFNNNPSHLSARIAQLGSGIPPYNSSNVPPIQWGYVFGCYSGFANDYVRMCYPYQNWAGWMIDQCIFAHAKSNFITEECAKLTNLFDEYSRQGRTAAYIQLRLNAFAALNRFHYGVRPDPQDEPFPDDELVDWSETCFFFPCGSLTFRFTSYHDFVVLYGDIYTRFRRVYTGDDTDTLPFAWM
jgi:hypothetical protein